MLAKIGVAGIDDLFDAVPKDKLLRDTVNLPQAKGELEVERELGRSPRATCRQPACPSSSAAAPIVITCRPPSIT